MELVCAILTKISLYEYTPLLYYLSLRLCLAEGPCIKKVVSRPLLF